MRRLSSECSGATERIKQKKLVTAPASAPRKRHFGAARTILRVCLARLILVPDYRLQRPFASVIVLTAIALSPGTEGYGQQRQQARALLRMPIGPVRAPNGRIPLPEALKAVGASLLDGNYAIFGLELRLKDGKEPTVKLKFERRGTLVEVLEQIMLQLPDYGIEFPSGHLVTIYPKGADDDPEDVLNLRVPRFHVDGERAGTIFTQPARFMPELQSRLTSGDSHAQGPAQTDKPVSATAEGPVLSMHLGNFTVREIFNMVSEATERYAFTDAPTGWVYSFQPQPASSNVSGHSFRALVTLPNNWPRHAEESHKGSSRQ